MKGRESLEDLIPLLHEFGASSVGLLNREEFRGFIRDPLYFQRGSSS